MLTPKRRGWPGWSPKTPSPPPSAEEMAGSSHVVMPAAAAGGNSGGRALAEAPPQNLLDNNGEIMAARGEPEIWRRFREARSLDEESLEKKDRVALVVHVTKLEAEDIIANKSIRDTLVSEEKFFRSCQVYHSLSEHCGIPQLAKKLNQVVDASVPILRTHYIGSVIVWYCTYLYGIMIGSFLMDLVRFGFVFKF